MPTYAPAPRQFKRRLTLPANAMVLCFAPGVAPDEGIRVPASAIGGGGGSVSPANPSVSLGLTVKNGSASTYMRSDAAPALDVSIAPTWTGLHTFNQTSRFKGGDFNDISIEFGSTNFGFSQYASHYITAQIGTGQLPVAFGGNGSGFAVGIILPVSNQLTWVGGSDPSAARDTGICRNSAGVLQINTGVAGTGGGLNFPETPSDADVAAPSTGATLFSKVVGGKNALYVRFPTGVVQQIKVEA